MDQGSARGEIHEYFNPDTAHVSFRIRICSNKSMKGSVCCLFHSFIHVCFGCSFSGGAADPFALSRRQMIEQQIRARGVKDPQVLAALQKIKRHLLSLAQSRAGLC